MSKWEKFFQGIQQDLKMYLFFLGVFTLYRIAFISILNQYLNSSVNIEDILLTLYYGLKISLKSSGGVVLLSFILCTVPSMFLKDNTIQKVRLYLGSVYILILSILFQIRIPYYEQFHIGFNQFIFNTLYDDVTALFYTFVQQYQLLPRVIFAVIISFILVKILKLILQTKKYSIPHYNVRYKNIMLRTSLIFGILVFMLFARFGGSFTYAHSIHWENSAKTKDEFLNETILDDVQALYRAHSLHGRMNDIKNLNIDTMRMKDYAAHLAGRSIESNNLNEYLKKEATGAKISKPKHIFLIIGESYAQWPLLDKYKDINIANGLKNVMNKPNAINVPAFLPQGPFTSMCVTGIVSGLANVNLYVNFEPQSYQEPYATAIAPQMKKLGYKTVFWYGGFSGWERIKDFTLAQGFDSFYSYGDLSNAKGNIWGSDDKDLFTAINDMFNPNEPSFHVILTVSNHAPYSINLEQEGFDESVIPEEYRNNKELVQKLGHFWYSDKVISEFIDTMNSKYPDSLFIVTGDHADRTNLDANPNYFERYSVPLIFYGSDINKNILPQKTAGNHINIAPTLIELIAPQGFNYYSVGNSLTKGNNIGMNHEFWINNGYVGKIGTDNMQKLPWNSGNEDFSSLEGRKQDIDGMRAISWWMVKKGNKSI